MRAIEVGGNVRQCWQIIFYVFVEVLFEFAL